ncbi:MAG: CoA pyrophosphatase [Rhodospirillales bacterium]|nr:CoA pyrophosphatase [Rhodospirillales bacterium]
MAGEPAAVPYIFTPALRERMAARMAGFERHAISDAALRHAAVAIIVAAGEDPAEASVLLTRRPQHLNRHAGQYALPGGRMDAGETPEGAALRETEEELGLHLASSAILGLLDDYATRSGFCITPVVIWGGPAYPLAPDPNEVARVFRVPLRELDAPEVPDFERPFDGSEPIFGVPLATLGHSLHAPTAAMLYQFREVALRGAATRVAHLEQPRFAWS